MAKNNKSNSEQSSGKKGMNKKDPVASHQNSSPSILPTSFVSYIYTRDQLKEIIKRPHKVIAGIEVEPELIGLLFRFKEVKVEVQVVNGVEKEVRIVTELPDLQISRVYYHGPGETSDPKFKEEPPWHDATSGSYFVEPRKIVNINGEYTFTSSMHSEFVAFKGSGDEYYLTEIYNHVDEGNGFIETVYKELEYYSQETEFVLFTIDQLEPLLQNFKKIIITGSQMATGMIMKPRGHKKYLRKKMVGSPLFTLKMEVEGFEPEMEEVSGLRIQQDPELKKLFTGFDNSRPVLNKRDGVTPPELAAPLLVQGSPCPPDWFPLSNLVESLLKKKEHAYSLYTNLYSLQYSWLQEVVKNPEAAKTLPGPGHA